MFSSLKSNLFPEILACPEQPSFRASASTNVIVASTSTASYSPKTKVKVIRSKPSASLTGAVEVVHDLGALNSAGQNWDGAGPDGRLTLGQHGTLYSNSEAGGANGNGVIYSVRDDGRFEVLHTFSATDPTTGANYDGANADNGVVLDGNRLIGIAIYGGAGSPAGYNNSGGTLYELTLDHSWH